MVTNPCRNKLNEILNRWGGQKAITRQELETAAQEVIRWRRENNYPGLWHEKPVFVTATIDDGWGNGLALIRVFAEAAGLNTHHLGLLQSPEVIVSGCHDLDADLLGLTVLQFDSIDALKQITREIPGKTRVVAGGPVFGADPELAARAGIHARAKDAADFWRFLLTFQPRGK